MRIRAAVQKAGLGMFALAWATVAIAQTAAGTSAATPAGQLAGPTSSTVPSIEILDAQSGLAGTCGGGAFDVNTFINVGTQASADVSLTVPGVGVVEQFTDETGKNIGPYDGKYPTFHIPSFGGGLAPNTPITLTITTYSGPALTGSVTFTSGLTFNCTTGRVVVLRAPGAGVASVPTFSPMVLLALAALVGLLGAATLRRRARDQR